MPIRRKLAAVPKKPRLRVLFVFGRPVGRFASSSVSPMTLFFSFTHIHAYVYYTVYIYRWAMMV